jgi:hypothetical protein
MFIHFQQCVQELLRRREQIVQIEQSSWVQALGG